jgi:hypothetical protein
MGCYETNPNPAADLRSPTYLQKTGDNPLSIQWEDRTHLEQGFIIYVRIHQLNLHFPIAQVDENVVFYVFDRKACEIAEYYANQYNNIDLDDIELQVASWRNKTVVTQEGATILTEKKVSTAIKLYEKNIPPLTPPEIHTVGYNPCYLAWSHNTTGFYECGIEEEEGYRIYTRDYPEDQTPNINDAGWELVATVSKHNKSYSFDQFCSEIFTISQARSNKIWTVVEAFNEQEDEIFSNIVLLHHNEAQPIYHLDPATYDENIWIPSTLGEDIAGSNFFIPENITFDGTYEEAYIISYSSEIDIRDEHPYIMVKARANNTGMDGRTRASIRYWFQVVPKTEEALLDIRVPVIVEVEGYASVTESQGVCWAIIVVSMEDVYTASAGACLNPDNPSSCAAPDYSVVDERYDLDMPVASSTWGGIDMTAHITMGSGEVVVYEPRIRIDPDSDINGVPATELYEIQYSEGITQYDE